MPRKHRPFTKTVTRNTVITLPDGTLDRVPLRFLIRFLVINDNVIILDETPVSEPLAVAPPWRRVQHAKDASGHPTTAKKRRLKPRKSSPDNVVGRVKLTESDLAGVR